MDNRSPVILFKEHKISSDWYSPLLDSRIQFIIYALAGFILNEFGKHMVITSIHREEDTGIHHYWRAIDIRSFIYKEEEIASILRFLNDNVVYGKGRYITAIYHDVGRGPHIHIQVSGDRFTAIENR